ncbi:MULTISPECIES: CRISPR-associated helicase/endonuclease Cas3 [Gammaproteobacteria]|uniref:CRISPR-associated helicase/endonuclease Cas3 n=1 Tax=Gammaproteobacteria TaxID=1236 RepID=UPI003A8DCEC1
MSDAIYRYWGKARKDDKQQGDAYHLLPYHSLDVAAVAACWWDNSPALRHLFCQGQLASEAQMRAWVLFFVALHDLGKFDVRFQCKAPDLWLALQPVTLHQNMPSVAECQGFDHGAAGLYWFINDHAPAVEDDGFGISEPPTHPFAHWFPWLEAVTGHHGTLRTAADVNAGNYRLPFDRQTFAANDKEARQQWLDTAAALFLAPAGLSTADTPPACSLLLAGFCSVADWLGSMLTEDTFHYCAAPCANLDALEQYFQQRYQHDARLAVARSGLLAKVKSQAAVGALLGKGHSPRQLQLLVDSLPVSAGLTLIEAPTGSGKTETALAYAWRLLEANLADSIIFALPTQATANAMLERMEKLAPLLFDSPNLVLAHGNARFNTQFQAIRQSGHNRQGVNAWSQCCDWISQSRKRVFLGQIGVCTIDQVLASALPLRHRFVRGFGVGRSVLIVDEIHAYDRYMYGLLEAVLADQAKIGSPVILLSATLPAQQKSLLLSAYRGAEFDEAQHAALQPYPLISWVSASHSQSFDLTHLPDQQPPSFSVQLESRYSEEAAPDEALLDALVAAASQGAQVCLICNRVDVAQHAYWQLQNRPTSGIELQLFHARYSLLDRRLKENEALRCFGRDGDRRPGRILVATQVVEQSLDLDFDWLVTQLCPVDLLFQRLGRLHRHPRANRPPDFAAPRATVLLPKGQGYGVLGKIYGHTRVMWRTQQRIEALAGAAITFPAAYRDWIEGVYQEQADDDEPAWVEEGMALFEQDVFTKQLKARQMRRWAQQASLADNDANERAVTRDGAQSLSLVPYVQTASGRLLLDGQSRYEQLGEYQQQEALALNQVNVPESWRRWLQTEPDEYQRYWLEGTFNDGVWTCLSIDFRYSKEIGMVKTIPIKSQMTLGTSQ